MTEEDPFEDALEKMECTKVQLRGPNVTNSLDKPPRPNALEVQRAAIRKHLHKRRGEGHPGGEEGRRGNGEGRRGNGERRDT